MIIEKYTREYENLRDSFKCGNNIIDNFLREGNALDENQGITYVMLSDKRDVIIGYYNIEVGRIDQREEVGNNIFYRPMGGTVNINYLAIHRDFQGIKVATVDDKNIYLGDILLNDCERLILSLRKQFEI